MANHLRRPRPRAALPAVAAALAGLVLATSPRVVRAQGTSDLQPTEPAPVRLPDGGYWVPGMPLPVVGGASNNNLLGASGGLRSGAPPQAPGAPGGADNRGRGSAVFDAVEMDTGIRADEVRAAGPIPETHVVKKGDTLWDISNSYFQSPWTWPRLWALNPLVTNPHWIYPGDVLRLRDVGDAPAPLPSAPGAPQAQPPTRRAPGETVTLRQTGFVDEGELRSAARVAGSREERVMLAALDEVYVEFKRDAPLAVGERYSIYRPVTDVKFPGGSRVAGSLVEIVGDVEVKSVNDRRIARGVIVESVAPVERGFRVGPLRRMYSLSEPTPSERTVRAGVIATIHPSDLVGESMVVFMDRGSDDGVAVGNRFLVVRRGDGIQPLLARSRTDDERFPREVFGEVQVVEVKARTATGIVLRSLQEIAVGDRLESRQGY